MKKQMVFGALPFMLLFFAAQLSAGIMAVDGDAYWDQLFGGVNQAVYTVVPDGPDIYIGGKFHSTSYASPNCVAMWRSGIRYALGDGITGDFKGLGPEVRAIALHQNHVYVGGAFNQAGAVYADNVAQWDGTSWTQMGSGMDNRVYAMSALGDDIYAGGSFLYAGGLAASYIARWDGTQWSALPGELDGNVYCMAADGTDLYVGGRFSYAGDLEVNHIARWDGSNWHALGDGFNGTVYSIAVHEGKVYAGGSFEESGGQTVNKIAEWDGSAWVPLGDGLSNDVFAISILESDVVAGGQFLWVPGLDHQANHIARWDGTEWTSLGSGVNDVCYALAVYGYDVYAGGSFTLVGDGVKMKYFARWRAPFPDAAFEMITGAVTENQWSKGASWCDYDDDGDLDLFVAIGNSYVIADTRDALYRNDGDLTFTKILDHPVVLDQSTSQCGMWGDYDNDDDPDLFVVTDEHKNNVLFKNKGNQAFGKVIDRNDDYTSSGTWVDYDMDGLLDFYITTRTTNPLYDRNVLYRNLGDDYFTQVGSGPIVTDHNNAHGCAWGDIDNDGDPDLFVPDSQGVNVLYQNQGNGVFIRMENTDVSRDESSRSGAWGDYDNDGDLDLFVANYGGSTTGRDNSLYRNEGDWMFTRMEGIDIVSDGGCSVSGSWCDYDNDGDLDLFVFNDQHQDNFLYQNNGDGSFTRDVFSYFTRQSDRSRSGCWGDVDSDGDLDLFVANDEESKDLLLINRGNSNHRINIRLTGTLSNRSGIGAMVRVKADIRGVPVWQMREVGTTVNTSQNEQSAPFGLGDAIMIDSLVVHWPSGVEQIMKNVAADQFLMITEAVNNPPVAEPDSVTILEGATETIAVLENDLDPDGDDLRIFSLITEGTLGTAVVDAGDTSVIYSAPAGFTGIDMFNYILDDNHGGRDTAMVKVNIESAPNSSPLAADDSAAVSQNSTIEIFVLSNDSDPDGDVITIQSLDLSGTLGTAQISSGDTTVTYTAPADYSGQDVFSYTITDGHNATSSALVHIEIPAANQPPVAVNDTVVIEQDSTVIIYPLVNDSDPDGDPLYIEAVLDNNTAGTVLIHSGDTSLTYVPPVGFSGEDSLDYVISDDNGHQATATVFITITPVSGVSDHAIPVSFGLHQNFPNPFNPVTTISYALPEKSHVTLRIFSVMGSEICTLVSEDKSAGQYEAAWNAQDRFGQTVSSGIYFYQLKAGDYTQIRKMLLVR